MFSLIPLGGVERALRPRAGNPFETMRREMETFFEPVFEGWPEFLPELEPPRFWGLTTEENEKEMVLRFELPGFEAKEVMVNLAGNVLTVEANHPAPEGKEAEAHRVRRVITLPANVVLESVEAVHRNGVLEVHLPRTPEAVARRIEVKT